MIQPPALPWLKRRPIWIQLIVFAVVGAIGAFAQAPFDIPALIFVMLGLGFVLQHSALTPWHAALTGWALGLGYFAITLSWIVSPFQVDPDTVWMAPFGLFFMAAGMALFWGLAFWAATAFRRHWALIITWTIAEILRAYVFTGFPWGSPPQALVDVFGGQALAYVGPHGVMLGMCAAGWSLARSLSRTIGGSIGVLVTIVAIAIPQSYYMPAPDLLDRPTIRLVQPNAPQDQKWAADTAWSFVHRALESTRADGEPDLIVWPETSVPTLLHNAQNVMQAVGEAGGDTPVTLGILRERKDQMLVNAMVVLDGQGAVTQSYDKHHLVPFGEYIPLRWAFNAVGLSLIGDMFGDGFGRGTGAKLLDFGALGTALPLICYEAVFAHDVNAAPARPDFLIQITNDAWFGDFAGPQQHLVQARMRAIEQGLPLARAANTGISAMIGPRGDIIASIALNQAGYVDANLPAPLEPTLYSKTGDKPLGIVLFLVAMMCLFGRMRHTKVRKP